MTRLVATVLAENGIAYQGYCGQITPFTGLAVASSALVAVAISSLLRCRSI